MPAKILSGTKLAQQIKSDIKIKIQQLISNAQPCPGLAVILVGDDHASQVYVNKKAQACKEVGINSHKYNLAAKVSEQELLTLINKLNNDNNIHGILVQLPLPNQINKENIINSISPNKDVDGFHSLNLGKLVRKQAFLQPCTPFGIIKLLESINFEFKGAEAVVIGESNIVGRPMALELLIKGATVTVCHHNTKSLEKHIKDADLFVVAVGKKNLIPGKWVKTGATVIDVGINRNADGTISGDVEFDKAQHAAYITPVPGGVGPMTVAILMQNTLKAYQQNTQ